MIPAATREAQALACLEAAEQHRSLLLRLSRGLTRCPDEAMDLYQQTLLNCHDAIQRNGFAGDRYDFYLRGALKLNAHKRAKQAKRFVPLAEGFEPDPDGPAQPDGAAELHLAEQIEQELAALPAAQATLFRLHLAGKSYRDIEQLTGQPRSVAHRIVTRLKDGFRVTFGQAWAALQEAAE